MTGPEPNHVRPECSDLNMNSRIHIQKKKKKKKKLAKEMDVSEVKKKFIQNLSEHFLF